MWFRKKKWLFLVKMLLIYYENYWAMYIKACPSFSIRYENEKFLDSSNFDETDNEPTLSAHNILTVFYEFYNAQTFYVNSWHIPLLNLQLPSTIFADHYLNRLIVVLATYHYSQLLLNRVTMDMTKINGMHSTGGKKYFRILKIVAKSFCKFVDNYRWIY